MLFVIVFVLPVFAAISVFTSWLALLPPLRKWSQNSATAKVATALSCGFAALLITFMLCTRAATYLRDLTMSLEGMTHSDSPSTSDKPATIQKTDLAVDEIWLYEMTPPAFRPICISSANGICGIEDWK